ncbi:hypothetical protein HCN44_007714, partial [Aphidius gifuensis]
IQEINKVTTGRLKNFRNNWKNITNDKFILNSLNGYKIPFTSFPFQHHSPTEKTFLVEEFKLIQTEINKLIKKGAIEEKKDNIKHLISKFKEDNWYKILD